MAQLASELLAEGKAGLIEAGTGTGKTFGYLVPAFAYKNHTKGQVFISTYSRYLQDQLLSVDFPTLQSALETRWRVVSLKGKNNYLCAHRMRQILQKGRLTADEAWILIKIICWLDRGGSGELERLNFSHYKPAIIRQLDADSPLCRRHCTPETCPYQRARQAAAAADFVIINHALLAQLLTSDNFSPAALIIDEAHHLPAALRAAGKVDLSQERVTELVTDLVTLAPGRGEAGKRTREAANVVLAGYETLLTEAVQFVRHHTTHDRLRLSPALRRNTSWEAVNGAGEEVLARLAFLVGWIKGQPRGKRKKDEEDRREILQQAELFASQLRAYLSGNPDRIQWLEVWEIPGRAVRVQLADYPLLITQITTGLFTLGRPVLLTSATLTTAGGFTYIKRILGLSSDTLSISLPPSFNFRDNMLIYVVEGGPSPADASFDDYSATILHQLALLFSGRVLGLLSSHQAVKSLYNKSNSSLYKDHIKLLGQRITGGRHNIITRFKTDPHTVLLGTSSFWEGLDVPGQGLSCVLIPRLPFSPPDDPITTALAEVEGNNMFEDFSLPQMLLRLRQGVGRLLRRPSDRGVVVILDSRWLKWSCRDDITRSLPAATIHIGPASDLTGKVEEWMGPDLLNQWRQEHRRQHQK
jgi:ATP-dependent DNA helicase DinG